MLKIMTIILAVPTMIASFWGMNVNVPFMDHPFGFMIALLLATGIAGVSAFVLWKKMF